jgi:hypothetical protein
VCERLRGTTEGRSNVSLAEDAHEMTRFVDDGQVANVVGDHDVGCLEERIAVKILALITAAAGVSSCVTG